MQYRDGRGVRATSVCGAVALVDAELGSGKLRLAWRNSIPRRLQSASQRAHWPLSLQGPREETARKRAGLGANGCRDHRLGGAIRGPQARRLPLCREPGDALAWLRHAGRILAPKLGRDETAVAQSRRSDLENYAVDNSFMSVLPFRNHGRSTRCM